MVRNILAVLSGALLAQLVGLAALPFLTRLYSPEDFAHFQFYQSCLSFLLVAVALRYDMALLNVQSKSDFTLLFLVVIVICAVTTIITAAIIYLSPFDSLAHLPVIANTQGLIIIGMIVSGVYSALTIIPVRIENYSLVTSSRLMQVLVYVASALILVFTPIALIGLIVADIFSRFVSGSWIYWKAKSAAFQADTSFRVEDIKATIAAHRSYPIYFLPGSLLTSILPVFLSLTLVGSYGLNAVGQYALVERMILLPIAVFAVAVGQVISGNFSADIRSANGEAFSRFKKLLAILFSLGLFGALIGYLCLPTLVPLVLGQEWVRAGKIAALMMPLAFANFVCAPFHMTLVILDRKLLQLSWELLKVTCLCLVLYFFTIKQHVELEVFLFIYSCINLMLYGTFLGLCFIAFRIKNKHNGREVN